MGRLRFSAEGLTRGPLWSPDAATVDCANVFSLSKTPVIPSRGDERNVTHPCRGIFAATLVES